MTSSRLSYQNIGMDVVLQNVSKSFCTKDKLKSVYKDFSCKLSKGTVHILYGENGCGKTTLLKIIKGIISQDDGSVLLNNQELEASHRLLDPNIKIQMQFDRGSWPFLTFKENLEWSLINSGLSRNEIKNAVIDLEQYFDLNVLNEKSYKDCNRGTKQILSALSVLAVPHSKIVLLDEPFSFLDQSNLDRMVRYLKSQTNKTIVFTTQDSFKNYFKDFNAIEIGKTK